VKASILGVSPWNFLHLIFKMTLGLVELEPRVANFLIKIDLPFAIIKPLT
jgi:hypothetical protein